MSTLDTHKARLEKEIMQAKATMRVIKESDVPDINRLIQLTEAIERNIQLIKMIDCHVRWDHKPMWRKI